MRAWREPLVARARRWIARHPSLVAVAVVTLVAGALLAGVIVSLTTANVPSGSGTRTGTGTGHLRSAPITCATSGICRSPAVRLQLSAKVPPNTIAAFSTAGIASPSSANCSQTTKT